MVTQIDREVKRIYGMLAFIRWGIECKSQDIILQHYKSLIRLHLVCLMQFWSPHNRKDVEALVQKRLARMLPRLYKTWSVPKKVNGNSFVIWDNRRLLTIFKILSCNSLNMRLLFVKDNHNICHKYVVSTYEAIIYPLL